MRELVDTSALLAVGQPRDQHHADAVRSGGLLSPRGWRWIGTTLVLAELHVAFAFDQDFRTAGFGLLT